MTAEKKEIILGGEPLTLQALWNWLEGHSKVQIHPSVRKKMSASRRVVENCLKDGHPHYGINTGFGSLAGTLIPAKKLEQLQYNLIKSHACGVGEPLPDEIVRAMMLLRANVLAMGYSGARYELLEFLAEHINKGKIPKIPSQGSVGASGDLAPLAHLALALVEDGLKLEPKEGLALINGTQATLAVAVVALRDMKALLDHANLAAALTLEGLRGSAAPFDTRIADVRPVVAKLALPNCAELALPNCAELALPNCAEQALQLPYQNGHAKVAEIIRELIKDSEIVASHKNCPRVQDPYSLRCVPQVHGAVWDTCEHSASIIEKELNSCTDNPLIFGDEMLSGGNFHGTSLALVCDHLSMAATVLGNISERRTEQMINPKQGDIPVRYLVKDAGVNSGFMVAHVVASALASENKTLSHPASSDSITTSGGQEDFVSMSMWAARKLSQVISNTEKIIVIELLAAAQAIDMQENKFSPGAGTKKVYGAIRKQVPTLVNDRELYKDIEKMLNIMKRSQLI